MSGSDNFEQELRANLNGETDCPYSFCQRAAQEIVALRGKLTLAHNKTVEEIHVKSSNFVYTQFIRKPSVLLMNASIRGVPWNRPRWSMLDNSDGNWTKTSERFNWWRCRWEASWERS